MYYVYVLKKRDGVIYIGYTNDLKRRLSEHREKQPELIYYEAYKNQLDAQDRERKLKQRGQAVKFLKQRNKGFTGCPRFKSARHFNHPHMSSPGINN